MRTIIGTGSELNVPIILIEDDSNYLICNNLKNNANKEEVPRFPLLQTMSLIISDIVCIFINRNWNGTPVLVSYAGMAEKWADFA